MAKESLSWSVRDPAGGGVVLASQMARRNQNMLQVRNMLGLENVRSKHDHAHTWRSTRHVQTVPTQYCVYCPGPECDVNLRPK